VLLLHGLGGHRRTWLPVVSDLAAHHDVIAPDLPGFGQSPAPNAPAPYDVGFPVEAVLRLCAELLLKEPHMAGNSLGGAVDLEMAARGAAASVTAFSPIGFGALRHSGGARVLAIGARCAARVAPSFTRGAVQTGRRGQRRPDDLPVRRRSRTERRRRPGRTRAQRRSRTARRIFSAASSSGTPLFWEPSR